MNPATNPSDPLLKLDSLAQAEASRRASERDRVRREFPAVTKVADMIRASQPDPANVRLVYASEGGREIGKLPAPECELTWHGSYAAHEAGRAGRVRR